MSVAAAVATAFTMNAGAPPSVMFLPDKTWCDANGYVIETERNGKVKKIEDYEKAFLNPDFKNVVVQLNALMKDNGLPVKDFAQTTQNDDEEEMEEDAYNNDTQSGGSMDLTDYEALLSKLRPDIVIRIGYYEHKVGFNYSLSYYLEAIDSYSSKSVAQVTGETPSMKTTVALAAALKSVATEHMGSFIGRLREHFDDLQANGREITVTCRIGNNGSGINFNSMFGDKDLNTVISDWMNDNTVNHVYSLANSSRNRMKFEQVRIPFTDSKGKAMQAREFVEQLKRYLQTTYNLKCENTSKGTGGGRLYDICQ